MRAYNAQTCDVVIERIERGHPSDHADGLVKFYEHRLGIPEQSISVRIWATQSFRNPGLELVLQQVVHRTAAGVDVELDPVPSRVISFKRSFGLGEVAPLECRDRGQERRAECLNARK